METGILISDAAKEVQVESHVLRYWEEELQLPIKRNELGHRYYTEEDVERFKQIKNMKERGLQLKAIKMIMKDGKFDMLPQETSMGEVRAEDREEKAKRLQWIMQQMIRQAVQENNAELVRQMKESVARQLSAGLVQQIRESVLKELDYQFRMQEEREEERAKQTLERTEYYYKQMDELLRKKSHRKKTDNGDTVKSGPGADISSSDNGKKEKKKRHFIF